MGDISKHFDRQEFACKCGCGYCAVSPRLVALLEKLRAALGNRPITINSACRCARHNASDAVKGVKNSQHLLGNAADIVVEGVKPDVVAKAAEVVGFDGVGRYKTFTHVDVRGHKARWKG